MTEAGGIKLGTVLSADSSSATVLTSTGNMVTIAWVGTIIPIGIDYVGTVNNPCSGSMFLESDGLGLGMFGKSVYFSVAENTLLVPAAATNGTENPVAITGVTGFEVGFGCQTGQPSDEVAYPLAKSSAAGVGLPGTGNVPSIMPPLTLG